ncbi:MAG TPA: tetratricopeptide repeat protein [Pyrinomonadaceae bacterium]|nr:tetratricopeptide repeat protein [Pyrinomonadaceae bacterium]
MPPDAPGLVPVVTPDTSSMEAGVREHIKSSESALASVIKDAGASADKLAEAYGLLGQIYQAYSLSSPAKECYQNAARLASKDFRWPYLLGKLHEREGDAQQAIALFNTARELRPDYLPVFVSLGNLHLQLNRLDEAEANFRRALEINEASASALYGLGQAALSKRIYNVAAVHLEKALKLAPEANRLHYALAMAFRGQDEMEKAQTHLAQSGSVGVRVSDPLIDGLQDLIKGARLHLIRGRTALEARRFAEAAAEFRKAIAAQPDSIPAHFNLGAALTQTGDLGGAVAQFEEILRLDPNHANAHYNLGLLLAQSNQTERAIKHLRLAVAAKSEDHDARFLLAQELVKAGRIEDAESEFARVVESAPDNEEALLASVRILLIRKEYRRALDALEKSHTRFPHKGRTAATLAYLLAASPQTDLRDGRRALELAQAIYAATGTFNHGALVATALAELGRCEEAAALSRKLMTKAVEERKSELAEKLKADLNRYEQARPCRPDADVKFSDQ